jgi:hypothetical protein
VHEIAERKECMKTAYPEVENALVALLSGTTPVTQHALIEQLREDWGNSEETEIYIDYLAELGETIEWFMRKIGPQRTAEIIASVC